MTAVLIILLMALLSGVVIALVILVHRRGVLVEERNGLEHELHLLSEKYETLANRFRPGVNLLEEAERLRVEIRQLRTDHRAFAAHVASQRQALNAQHQAELQRLQAEQQAFVAKATGQRQALSADYQQAKAQYDRLRREVSLLEENLEDISFGLYKPHYEFDTSDAYRQRLDEVREKKKQLVRNDQATECLVQWTVGGSRSEGERMQKQLAKLMLRAFNGESDAALANVRWNNITRMEERLRQAYNAINKLGTVVQVTIAPAYLDLALQELRLQFEYEDKRRAEAEEQRIIKERMREEERAQRELERAAQEAAAEELRYEQALEAARIELAAAKGAEWEALRSRMRELEARLAEKHAERERAISMAQQTRSGHVYVLSNIGSFGENVYKIGMTRRRDPKERVWELSDASVPFDFDVHAMVFTDDAPDLECSLHRLFRHRRVNLVNERKEFFHISLHEIEQALSSRGLKIELTKLAEAREYRETVARRTERDAGQSPQKPQPIPQTIEVSAASPAWWSAETAPQ